MKKLLLSALSLSLLFVNAQEKEEGKLYFGIKSGYSFAASKSTIGSPKKEIGNRILVVNEEGNYTYLEKNPFGSRGAGLTFAGHLGYFFNNNFGVEMEFSFIRSSKILDASVDRTNDKGQNYFAEQHSYTNMFRMAPMLVVQGNPNKKFVPYAKFGLLVTMAGKTIVESTINDQTGELADELLPLLNPELLNELDAFYTENPTFPRIPIATENTIKAKTAGQFSLGFASRIGCNYNINNNWALYAEMEMNMLTVKSKETVFTDFTSKVDPALVTAAESLLGKPAGSIQGTYTTSDLPEILRVTTYLDEVTQSSNTSYDPARKDEALEQLTFRDNYNSFGFNLGFKYTFNSFK